MYTLNRFLLFISTTAYSQLSLEGEYWPRTEFRSGYKILSTSVDEPAFFTSQRTRLALLYKEDLYTFNISGQDIRTWSEVEQLGDTPSVNIHEAWAKLKVTETLDLQLGRQEFIYDDQRLLGNVNWAQQAKIHDALRLRYKNKEALFYIDLGGAYNQEKQKLLDNDYDLANYLRPCQL